MKSEVHGILKSSGETVKPPPRPVPVPEVKPAAAKITWAGWGARTHAQPSKAAPARREMVTVSADTPPFVASAAPVPQGVTASGRNAVSVDSGQSDAMDQLSIEMAEKVLSDLDDEPFSPPIPPVVKMEENSLLQIQSAEVKCPEVLDCVKLREVDEINGSGLFGKMFH